MAEMDKIKFQIEIDRVLDVLSKEIYDSPYALLRENIQNAYDAILMREQYTGGKWSCAADGLIHISFRNHSIEISDNGIGMSSEVLVKNYWRAGSSGKHTELAAKAGVIGTFGIGGMANLGVCTRLRIETESLEKNERVVSEVERKNLSLTQDCITIQKTDSLGSFGTTITTNIDPELTLAKEKALEYLRPYVRYLPVKVEIDGQTLSQKSLEEDHLEKSPYVEKKWTGFEFQGIKSDVLIQIDYNGRVTVLMTNVFFGDEAIKGIVCLKQDSGPLWGYRSFFGLAPIPLNSIYSFGGVINISPLKPTAGREALTKESVTIASRILRLAEECATQTMAESEVINRSNSFMSYVLQTGKLDLAENLKIRVEPERDMTLGDIRKHSAETEVYLYEGTDDAIVRAVGTPDKLLIVLSRSYPRRTLESGYLQRFCKLKKIADTPQILQTFDVNSYNMTEVSFVLNTSRIIEDDYLLPNFEVKFAELSHNLPLLARARNECVEIFVQKDHSTIIPVLNSYSNEPGLFVGILKDYVRVYVYPQIRQWVPSSTREAAEALQKILNKRRELYQIDVEDVGFTSTLADFMAGKLSFEEVTAKFKTAVRAQTLSIGGQNIGNLEHEIPNLLISPVVPRKTESPALTPSPAIFRTDIVTDKKLLVVDQPASSLNDFQLFMAISDRAFKAEYAFFTVPHTTRIIWGGRRIIFILTHPSSTFSLYYDIELFEDIGGNAGGGVFPTTTIVTKNKIFVPIPSELKPFFDLKEKEKREFYVRFDTV